MTSATCSGCGMGAVDVLLDFGLQPPSNRFLPISAREEDTHPLIIGQCGRCALVQLLNPMPVSMVKSRFDWLIYNEPESHLDALVKRLGMLDGISQESSIRGLTYKDDSTLARFARWGYSRTFRYDLENDLGVADRCAGLETIQELVDENIAVRLTRDHGRADVLIVRHVLEHAHQPARFLQALGRIVEPDGYLVFEVPDCRKFIEAKDYSFVWEEHICYFSRATASQFALRNGFAVVDLLSYSYALEDSLVLILRRLTGDKDLQFANALQDEFNAGRAFAGGFQLIREQVRTQLAALKANGKRIAVFGAGHLAVKFLNFFNLGDFVECVVDDNAYKQGLRMPGSQLPILGSAFLTERNIDLCLLSLNPESEQKVIAKQQDYATRGGEFASIFMLSPNALCNLLKP